MFFVSGPPPLSPTTGRLQTCIAAHHTTAQHAREQGRGAEGVAGLAESAMGARLDVLG